MITRNIALLSAGLLAFCGGIALGDGGKSDLSGSWKIDPARCEAESVDKNLTLEIRDTGNDIHIVETRGPDAKDDVSEFTCGKLGKECKMKDGRDKAAVTVYYNGPALVVVKTNGRKGSSVEKRRYALNPAGDTLIVEVMRIDPEGKPEKLVFTK